MEPKVGVVILSEIVIKLVYYVCRQHWCRRLDYCNALSYGVSGELMHRLQSFDIQITVLATGVLRLLDHVCGTGITGCQFIYGGMTVLNC